MTSLLQVIERLILSNAGRQAVSYFHTQGDHLGQALDSGGSDHIAGQRDVERAYDWRLLHVPIPVTTAT